MSVASHLATTDQAVQATYDRLIEVARTLGPLKEEAKKTSIHLVRHTAFAGVARRRSWLVLTLKSAADIRSPRIQKREQTSANRWHFEIRLDKPAQIDRQLRPGSEPRTISPGHECDAQISSTEGLRMPRVTLGLILGLSIGIVDVLLMLPLSFPDKRTALLAAFSSRFSLGFFAAVINLRVNPIVAGLLVGLLTSIPDAIVTKAYAPILITGLVFGAIAGWIVGRWAAPF